MLAPIILEQPSSNPLDSAFEDEELEKDDGGKQTQVCNHLNSELENDGV